MSKTYRNEQLQLFPEQPKEVDTLLAEIVSINANLKQLERSLEIAKNALYKNRSHASRRLQEVCIHPEIKIENDHDYHNNIWWEEHVCTTCDKMIKRI